LIDMSMINAGMAGGDHAANVKREIEEILAKPLQGD
jgi:hypothetical protein